ncbi:hypothetical protein F4813DRAFT_360962 [Daldinia decipiens]|uniref:uncharacterized protein n=1 Tax=Daldinia decipiens TaxID=326647 RepID=UPI0020C357EF|nr:uncharacterized protein F4813DRAFT_360962 [Daldinia decipiens]KAI1657288.1 hypothetical protein F4813DRAFT_360962 [Daldinia decipiens]
MANVGLGSAVQNKATSLKNAFAKDRRFQTIGLIANGSYGFTMRVQIKDPTLPGLENIVVKHINGARGSRTNLAAERKHLEALQDNLHIVRLINIPDNPLSGRVDRRDWIILEWLEYGELRSFITKSRIMIGRGVRLPNRLLWRFFTCLVRCCIAMAWPDSGEEVQRDVELSGIVHGDLHQGNILLGEPPQDDEHGFTPILKLIDFGGTEQYPPSEDADNQNVYDIGQIMLGVINLNRGRDSTADEPFYTWNGRRYRTEATALIPTPTGVDHALCTAVCACMSENASARPSLNALLRVGLRGLKQTPEVYGDAPEEQDDFILLTWRAIINDAPTDDDGDLTDDWSTSAPSTGAPSVGGTPVRPADTPSSRRPSTVRPADAPPSRRPSIPSPSVRHPMVRPPTEPPESSVGSPPSRRPSTRLPGTSERELPLNRRLFPSSKASSTGRPKRRPSEDSTGTRWE